jgi:hypothetical protein
LPAGAVVTSPSEVVVVEGVLVFESQLDMSNATERHVNGAVQRIRNYLYWEECVCAGCVSKRATEDSGGGFAILSGDVAVGDEADALASDGAG